MLSTRAHKLFEGCAGRVISVGGALAERVHAAVDVGAVMALKVLHGTQHRLGHLRRGGVVQVRQRMALHMLRERRKQRAQPCHA